MKIHSIIKMKTRNIMKMKIRSILLIGLSILATGTLSAQSITPFVIANSGGEGAAGGMQLQWTLGEVAIDTHAAGDLVLTQGFHQPDLIITSVEELAETDIHISVFPNPTPGHVTLSIDDERHHKMGFVLYDVRGHALISGSLSGPETQIDLQQLSPGTYVLHILHQNKAFQALRLVKNR